MVLKMQLYDCLSEFPPPEKWPGLTHIIPLESRDYRRHVNVTLATQRSSAVHLNYMYEHTCISLFVCTHIHAHMQHTHDVSFTSVSLGF